MAVVRITLDKCAHLNTAAALRDDDSLKRAAREFERAAGRPGLQAELTAEEMRAVNNRAASLLPRVRAALPDAMERLRTSEASEARRPRARDLMRAHLGLGPDVPLREET